MKQTSETTQFLQDLKNHIPKLVCLASVRTIRRLSKRSHFKIIPSDLIRRTAQTLGWYIDISGTIQSILEYEIVHEGIDDTVDD